MLKLAGKLLREKHGQRFTYGKIADYKGNAKLHYGNKIIGIVRIDASNSVANKRKVLTKVLESNPSK